MKHFQRYIAKLETLEEVEGVIMAANVLERVVPIAEIEALERRLASLTSPRTAEQARELKIGLRKLKVEPNDAD